MNKAAGIFFILFLVAYQGFSQIADPGFAKHLKDNRNFEELLILDQLNKAGLDQAAIDSLSYYTGWAHYSLQNLEKGIEKFSSVSSNSKLFNASCFFASWSELYLKNTGQAIYYAAKVRPVSRTEKELASIFATGIALTERDLTLANSLIQESNKEDQVYRHQWERMQVHSDRLQEYKPKSYAMAGLLSTVVPGAGKIYTGQKGAGVSSLLSLGAMAAISIENIVKTGWKSWNSILAAGTFGVFYFGNIYGSVVGVKVYRERFNNEVDRAVLLDINIPLRNIYR